MEEKSKQNYEFKKRLKQLKSVRGQGTELISIYIAPGYPVIEMTNRLRDEYGQAANIKSKQTRKNVQSAIDRILHMLKGVYKPPETGVAIFCGSIHDKIELYTIIPPSPINITTYRCDSTFLTEPLEQLMESSEYYGLFTMDRREATIATLKGKHIEILQHFNSTVPGKHRKGGQSSVRFERLIEIAAHEFFKKIGDAINTEFAKKEIVGIIAGGSGPTKQFFLNGDYLQTAVKNKIVGVIDTSYTDEFGIREIVDRADEVIKELETTKEKEIVQKFVKEAVTGGLATYGEKEVRAALQNGQVKQLLLSEELDWIRAKSQCACGESEWLTLKRREDFQPKPCTKCGGRTQLAEEKPLVDDLLELAESMGTDVVMISTETPEGEQFKMGFGGIGALLRYK